MATIMDVDAATAAANKKRGSDTGINPEKKVPTKDQLVLMSDLKGAVAECMKDGLKEVMKDVVNECMQANLTEVKSGLKKSE